MSAALPAVLCPICGARFMPVNKWSRTKVCSRPCAIERMKRIYQRDRAKFLEAQR